MSDAGDIFIIPHAQEDARSCHLAWMVLKRFVSALGHERFPDFIRAAVSVAESPGRVSLRTYPEQAAEGECGVFTVLSANLWHDFPRYKNLEQRLGSFARLIEAEKVDLILLQEVARTPAIQVDSWLAERLGMAYAYSRANGSIKIGFEEGLSVFSRFPFKRLPYLRQLGSRCNPFVRRIALGMEVDTPCGEILAFSVHLALPRRQNALQLRELHQWISQMAGGRCAVIGGDFNAPEHAHHIKAIRSFWEDAYRAVHEHGDAVTHEICWPWGAALIGHRLDYIFVQPGQPAWRVLEVHHVDAPDGPHSDHRAVLARLSPVHGV